jgi:hypothetical protein
MQAADQVFIKTLAQLFVDFSARHFFKNNGMNLWLKILTVSLIIIGSIFLLTALYVWIAKNYPVEIALLTMSIIIFCLSLISSLFAFSSRGKNKSSDPEIAAAELLRTVEQEVDGIVEENPRTSVLLAAIAGFLTGKL